MELETVDPTLFISPFGFVEYSYFAHKASPTSLSNATSEIRSVPTVIYGQLYLDRAVRGR